MIRKLLSFVLALCLVLSCCSLAMAEGEHPSLGLRINPEHSRIETLLYNPCAPGSRTSIRQTGGSY